MKRRGLWSRRFICYDYSMKLFLLAAAFFLSGSVADAYSPVVVNPERPFDVIAVQGNLQEQQEFLGDLNDFPEMYEVVVTEPIEFAVQVRQSVLNKTEPISLIVVRLDGRGRGVTEVVRLNQLPEEWTKIYNQSLGMSFFQSKQLSFHLVEGTYRIEVSTPNNQADYMLTLGKEPKTVGYFSMLSSIIRTQSHFGYSVFRILLSPYYYIPVLLLLFGTGFYLIKRRETFYA